MPYSPARPVSSEPTSIGPPVESGTCQLPDCAGDPKAPGRLDEVTFLLERCYQATHWPWRQPGPSPPAEGLEPGQETAAKIPRPTRWSAAPDGPGRCPGRPARITGSPDHDACQSCATLPA